MNSNIPTEADGCNLATYLGKKLLLHAYCGLISIDVLRHFRAIEPVRLSRSEKRGAVGPTFPIAQTLTVRYKNLIGLAE